MLSSLSIFVQTFRYYSSIDDTEWMFINQSLIFMWFKYFIFLIPQTLDQVEKKKKISQIEFYGFLIRFLLSSILIVFFFGYVDLWLDDNNYACSNLCFIFFHNRAVYICVYVCGGGCVLLLLLLFIMKVLYVNNEFCTLKVNMQFNN